MVAVQQRELKSDKFNFAVSWLVFKDTPRHDVASTLRTRSKVPVGLAKKRRDEIYAWTPLGWGIGVSQVGRISHASQRQRQSANTLTRQYSISHHSTMASDAVGESQEKQETPRLVKLKFEGAIRNLHLASTTRLKHLLAF